MITETKQLDTNKLLGIKNFYKDFVLFNDIYDLNTLQNDMNNKNKKLNNMKRIFILNDNCKAYCITKNTIKEYDLDRVLDIKLEAKRLLGKKFGINPPKYQLF